MKQSSSKKSMNELRDATVGGSSSSPSSFNPLVLSQKTNLPSSSSFSSLEFVNNNKPSTNTAAMATTNFFLDENFMQQDTAMNGANNLPAIPPRSTQTSSALPRPEPNQRLNKGLLPPPLPTTGRMNVETKGDPFADDFFS